MRIRTRIVGPAIIVVIIVNLIHILYFLDKSRNDALMRLQNHIVETKGLLKVVTAGPLYDGNVEQLNTDLDSFFINPDVVEINLREFRGDINISRKREPLPPLGELIHEQVIVTRGIDELGKINITYTTAYIEKVMLETRNDMIFFSLILIFGLVVVIFLGANRLTRPIDRFTEAARAMANGKLDQTIETRGARELRILGQSFIRMRDAIQEKIADLAEKNQQLNEEIQQRISAEQALKVSEEKYRSFFEQSVNPMLLAKGAQFIDGNTSALMVLGLDSLEELKKLTVLDISPEKQPDGTDSKSGIEANIANLKNKGSAYLEWYHKRKDGDIFPVAISLTVIGEEDGEPMIHVIWQDITDRIRAQQALKESEEKYRSLFEKSVNPMLLAKGLQFIDGNAAALNMLGLDSIEELKQLTVMDISPEQQPEGGNTPELIEKMVTSLIQQGGSAYTEWYHKRKNGDVFPVAVSLTVIGTENDEPITHVIWQDITDRKLAEEELINYRQHLEELVEDRTNELTAVNKELEAFSYSVSHDLRAPLRSIDGFSQALLEDYTNDLDEEGQHYLQRIRAGAQRMGELIDALLELSRVTRREVTKQAVDLTELAQEVLRDLQHSEPEREVSCTIQSGMHAKGDKQLLHIVLANLLGNAFKYTSKQPEARIEFGCKTENGETVYFIEDNGAGFNMDFAEKLFSPFQRMHRPDEFPGSGVGLATVSRIISKHGGRIWAQSEPDKGSTFFFTLD